MRLADWPGDEGRVLLTFSVWSHDLKAYDLKGKSLWTYPQEQGIDDVWATRVPGSKAGGVIVGFNGGTGLHVLDNKGQILWKTTALANVWHVSAGDVSGEGTPQVVSTSARGQVHVFGSDFQERKDLDAGCYANMVRVGKLSDSDKAATIFVAGTATAAGANPKSVFVTALSGAGEAKWTLEAPCRGDSACRDLGRPGSREAVVWPSACEERTPCHVVDGEHGTLMASVKGQGISPEVGWISVKGSENPVVLVATRNGLNAFQVVKAEK